MTNREKFKRAVIEAIHRKPYEEAVIIEWRNDDKTKIGFVFDDKLEEHQEVVKNVLCRKYAPVITIGRVIQALNNNRILIRFGIKLSEGCIILDVKKHIGLDFLRVCWKLTKPNGEECTDDDQPDETINKLLKLSKWLI